MINLIDSSFVVFWLQDPIWSRHQFGSDHFLDSAPFVCGLVCMEDRQTAAKPVSLDATFFHVCNFSSLCRIYWSSFTS